MYIKRHCLNPSTDYVNLANIRVALSCNHNCLCTNNRQATLLLRSTLNRLYLNRYKCDYISTRTIHFETKSTARSHEINNCNKFASEQHRVHDIEMNYVFRKRTIPVRHYSDNHLFCSSSYTLPMPTIAG